MPKIGEFLFGGKDKIKKASTLTPEQSQLIELIKQGLESGEGPLKDLFGSFDENAFNEGVKQPLLKEFQDSVLPMLNEKFISGGQVGGSGMQRANIKAATDLQSKLASLMYDAKQKQQGNRLAGLQTALGTKSVENIYKQGNKGVVPGFIEGVGEGIGKAAGAAIAG